MRIVALLSLLLTVAAPTAAFAAPTASSSTPAAAATPTAPDPDATYYPAAARAAGVEGKAVIHCGRTSRLKLTGCTLVSETPAGQGFGAAALAMAADSVENPKVDTTEAALTQPADIPVTFSLHPPGIDPDLTAMAHVRTSPSVVSAPTHEQIRNAYPVRALSDSVEGVALLRCVVSVAGGLEQCRVLAERPNGYGFGLAALDLAADFKLKPQLDDGVAVTSLPLPISVPFALDDPNAPLQLQTVP
jgi:TonB family protein